MLEEYRARTSIWNLFIPGWTRWRGRNGKNASRRHPDKIVLSLRYSPTLNRMIPEADCAVPLRLILNDREAGEYFGVGSGVYLIDGSRKTQRLRFVTEDGSLLVSETLPLPGWILEFFPPYSGILTTRRRRVARTRLVKGG